MPLHSPFFSDESPHFCKTTFNFKTLRRLVVVNDNVESTENTFKSKILM